MEKKILVTGGAGYVGSIVVEKLIEAGYRAVVFDNLSTGHRSAVHPASIFVHGDIRSRDSVEAVFREHQIDAVIHMAAKALIPESIADPAPFYDTNMTGGIILLDSMRSNGVKKIVFSSTAAVYGEPEYLPLDEKHPTKPMNSYGDTKLSFEKALKWYSGAYGLEATAFRYFSAAGASDAYGEAHVPETHLIPRVLDFAVKGGPAQVYGDDYDTPDGTCIRDFIHILDLADAHIRALEVPYQEGFRVYNMGSEDGYSVYQMIGAAEEIVGKEIERAILPRRAGDPARLVASSQKAQRELGWQPRHQSLREILASAWQWHRKNPNGYQD